MRGIFVKILVGGPLFSFPVALYYFYVTELDRMQAVSPTLSEVSKAVEMKEKEMEVLDGRILQARGEVLKFEEMKSNLVYDLIILKDRITTVISKNMPEDTALPENKNTPYSLTNLMRFESGLKKTQTSGPLRFRNVRISLKNDHLRINADIEKRTGKSVEGFAFIAAEYESEEGGKFMITSHGQRDWEGAVSTIKSATYFKARIKTGKRFDIVHALNKSAKLVSLKLVAKDTVTGQTVIEEITPNVQSDVLGL